MKGTELHFVPGYISVGSTGFPELQLQISCPPSSSSTLDLLQRTKWHYKEKEKEERDRNTSYIFVFLPSLPDHIVHTVQRESLQAVRTSVPAVCEWGMMMI